MFMRPLATLGLLIAPLWSSAQDTTEAGDPLTGGWKGTSQGEHPEIPPEGLGLTLYLEHVDEREARVRMEVDGGLVAEAEADFDDEQGWLSFRTNLMGIQVDVEAQVEGDTLAGDIAALGLALKLSARRVALELPRFDPPPVPVADPATLSSEDWIEDLHVLLRELPLRHANAFHALSEAEWLAAGQALEARLPELDAHASSVALAQLVARVGDAHTELGWRGFQGWYVQPVRFELLSDGLFVSAIDERWAQGLAARVVRVGALTTEQAIDAVSTTFAVENDYWKRAKAPGLLATPRLLLALGVIESEAELPLVVETEPGVEERLVVGPALPGSRALEAPDPRRDPLPLWRQRTQEAYWFELLEGPALYLAYNRCAEDPGQPMADFAARLLERFDASSAERLIIDLRNNSGGNSAVLGPLLRGIAARPRLAERGRLVALIGSRTYSSGMRNALELRDAGALLLGEPTGGRPDSYGEQRVFQLPRSGLSVHFSTRHDSPESSDTPSVFPDRTVALDSQAFFFGQDPVLEAALELEIEADEH